MTPEEIDIVRLAYAREFYRQGNTEKGNLFVKAVERSDNKTDQTKKLLDTVRRNIRLYSSQDDSGAKNRSLKLLPAAKKGSKQAEE